MQKPTIGRIVHYEENDDTMPAILTHVDETRCAEGRVSLVAFSADGIYIRRYVPHADTPTNGAWSWPPRDPPATTEAP